ncbi:MAG: hypothetical protein ABL903_07535 [Methylococcales bacterium]
MKFLILTLALVATAFSAYAIDLPAGHPPINGNKATTAPATLGQKAKVLEVINVPQYTYLELSQNNQSRWIAAPTVAVKKNDLVAFDEGMIMKDFFSKTLNRTFPSIAFVNRVVLSQ